MTGRNELPARRRRCYEESAADVGDTASTMRRRSGHAAANPAWSANVSTSSGEIHTTSSVSKFMEAPNRSGTCTTKVVYDQFSAGANTTCPMSTHPSGTWPTSSEASRRAPLSGDSPSSSAPPAHDHVPPSWANAERRCSITRGPSSSKTTKTTPAAPNMPQRWRPSEQNKNPSPLLRTHSSQHQPTRRLR